MAKDDLVIRGKLLADHPRIKAIAKLINSTDELTLIKMMKFWDFATKLSKDGLLRNVTTVVVDQITGCQGLAAAIIAVGWGEETPEGFLVADWDKHLSDDAKKRRQHAIRQARYRDRKKVGKVSQSNTSDANNVTRDAKNTTRDANSVTNEAELKCDIPDLLNAPEFIEVWNDWERHRIEKKQKLTPTNRKAQLKKLAAEGLAVALWRVRRSIDNGWLGLWFKEDKEDGKPNERGYRPIRGGGRMRTETGEYANLDNHNVSPPVKPGEQSCPLFDQQDPFDLGDPG